MLSIHAASFRLLSRSIFPNALFIRNYVTTSHSDINFSYNLKITPIASFSSHDRRDYATSSLLSKKRSKTSNSTLKSESKVTGKLKSPKKISKRISSGSKLPRSIDVQNSQIIDDNHHVAVNPIKAIQKKKRGAKPGSIERPEHSPALRPHIIRDKIREKQFSRRVSEFKHNIYKMTRGGESESERQKSNLKDFSSIPKEELYNPEFSKLHLMGPLMRSIYDMSWKTPTPVQIGTIPLALRGLNIVASAETGTGKTAAYGLPMLQRIYIRKKWEEKRQVSRIAAPLGIVLCPTRELAEQVEDQLFQYAKHIDGMRIVGISGAFKDVDVQLRALKKGVDILVATPGRLLRLLDNSKIQNHSLSQQDLKTKQDMEDRLEDERLAKLSMKNFDEEDEDSMMMDVGDFEAEDMKLDDLSLRNVDYEEEFDDGFGDSDLIDEGDDLLEVMSDKSKEIDEAEFSKMIKGSSYSTGKSKNRKREEAYSKWDRELDLLTAPDISSSNLNSTPKYKEKLPDLNLPSRHESQVGREASDGPSGAFKNDNIDLTHVRFLALDEVDRMLAMGMFPEVRHLFRALPRPQSIKDPEKMQLFMFTATLVPRVQELVKRFAPRHIRVDLNRSMNVASKVKQFVYEVGNRRKHALLVYLLSRKGSMKGQQCLVFCRTKQRVDRLADQLSKEDGISSAGIHGDQTLASRQRILDQFRDGQIQVLVATEIMARGMDIPNLPFVVNYDLPHSAEEYVHRIGRTARAGNQGTAFSFVAKDPILVEVGKRLTEIDEAEYLRQIVDFLKTPNLRPTKVPGPWLDDDRVWEYKGKKLNIEDSHSLKVKDKTNEQIGSRKESLSKSGHGERQGSYKNNTHISRTGKSSAKQTLEEKKESVIQKLVLNVAKRKVLESDQLKRQLVGSLSKKKVKYIYPDDDPELQGIVPPERHVVDRVESVLNRLVDSTMRANQSNISHEESQGKQKQHQLPDNVRLRDFKEGRYEDVMKEFDSRRARKLGIHVPRNLDSLIEEKRRKIDDKYKAKKILKRLKKKKPERSL